MCAGHKLSTTSFNKTNSRKEVMKKPRLDNYKRVLSTLDEVIVKPPANKLERDGIIQRFEYCLEISWVSEKKF